MKGKVASVVFGAGALGFTVSAAPSVGLPQGSEPLWITASLVAIFGAIIKWILASYSKQADRYYELQKEVTRALEKIAAALADQERARVSFRRASSIQAQEGPE
ncbi:MAG: hypothetical protein K0U98_04070 [Deltaproteobacteria bacterium]|nr:hypothetical protein [Deltaproteobacteria bacterium]